jgi:hypothetical protein
MGSSNIAKDANGPGLYLAPNRNFNTVGSGSDATVIDPKNNKLYFLIDTFSTPGNLLSDDIITDSKASHIIIDNIPMQKWFFLTMRCQTTKWDIYINGNLKQSIQLNNAPRQNYGDVFICNGGKGPSADKDWTKGFDGKLSNLIYSPYALKANEIMEIFMKGPNLTNNAIKGNSPLEYNVGVDNNFLANTWY